MISSPSFRSVRSMAVMLPSVMSVRTVTALSLPFVSGPRRRASRSATPAIRPPARRTRPAPAPPGRPGRPDRGRRSGERRSAAPARRRRSRRRAVRRRSRTPGRGRAALALARRRRRPPGRAGSGAPRSGRAARRGARRPGTRTFAVIPGLSFRSWFGTSSMTGYVTTFWTVCGESRICETVPLNDCVGIRVDREGRDLALADAADVGLVDVREDLHLREVLRDHEERRRLERRRDGLADVVAAAHDDPVDRRDDARVREVRLGLLELRRRPARRSRCPSRASSALPSRSDWAIELRPRRAAWRA